MSNATVRAGGNELSGAVEKLIKEYGDKAFDMCEATAKTVARQAVSDLKGSAPSGGSYARGWSHKAQKNGYSQYTDVVYNRTDYQLTHLLEKSHPTGKYGGGKYPTNIDYTGTMARVEKKFTEMFAQEVISKL